MIREIESQTIERAISECILRVEYNIDPEIKRAVEEHELTEISETGRQVLRQLSENYKIAADEQIAICQDTGMCVVFAEVGQDAHIVGDSFEQAINRAVADAYANLRKSVVNDPLYDRINTKDNTPAIIHTRIVPGCRMKFTVICKGFGSENMSRIKMLTPSAGENGVIDFVVETVRLAGANPCPPIILGVCVGGDFEQAAAYAKLMTAEGMCYRHSDPRYQRLEEKISERINALGIGPAGFGGNTTLLKLNICSLPTHIAGMPCAINVCCHASRHGTVEI